MQPNRPLLLALAAALLALAPPGAAAQTKYFREAHRWEDPLRRPFILINAGFGDIDGDGDRDRCGDHELDGFYCAQRTLQGFDWPRPLNPMRIPSGLAFSILRALDVDADGDDDFVFPSSLRANGPYVAQLAPGVVEYQTSTAFQGFDPGPYVYFHIETGDLDMDGLADAVLGLGAPLATPANRLAFMKQVAPGAFEVQVGDDDPFRDLTFPGATIPAPALTDHDGDGDRDLLVLCTYVCGDRHALYFEQTAPGAFVERTGAANPLAWLDAEWQAGDTPDFEDVDGDGDDDLLMQRVGAIALYVRDGAGYTRDWNPYGLFGGFMWYWGIWPAFADVDGDGDTDVAVGHDDGRVYYLSHTGLAATPYWDRQLSEGNPFRAIVAPGSVTPALGDVDGDGDVDLVTVANGAATYYAQVAAGVFEPRSGAESPVAGLSVGPYPALGDVDGDGDPDLVTQDPRDANPSRFLYFEQVEGRFVARSGTASPLDGLSSVGCASGAPSLAKPVLGDLDGDEDVDLVSGRCFYQNLGGVFVTVSEGNPLADLLGGVAGLVDLNGDGHVDAVDVYQGGFRTWLNMGTPVGQQDGPGGVMPAGPPLHIAPNPSAGRGSVRVAAPTASVVRVVVYDALGRRVAVLHDGPLVAGSVVLPLDVSGLRPGVYVVRATGRTWTAASRLVVAR